MCIPLDVPAPIFKMNKQILLLRRFAIPTQDWDSSESGSTDGTDSCECECPPVELHSHTGPIHVEIYHRPDVSIVLKALEKQRPKIWQLKPSGIVAGMMIPIWVGFEDPCGGNTNGEEAEEAEEAK